MMRPSLEIPKPSTSPKERKPLQGGIKWERLSAAGRTVEARFKQLTGIWHLAMTRNTCNLPKATSQTPAEKTSFPPIHNCSKRWAKRRRRVLLVLFFKKAPQSVRQESTKTKVLNVTAPDRFGDRKPKVLLNLCFHRADPFSPYSLFLLFN